MLMKRLRALGASLNLGEFRHTMEGTVQHERIPDWSAVLTDGQDLVHVRPFDAIVIPTETASTLTAMSDVMIQGEAETPILETGPLLQALEVVVLTRRFQAAHMLETGPHPLETTALRLLQLTLVW